MDTDINSLTNYITYTKYIHEDMNVARVSSSRELVISKSTRKLDKRDSRRIETV